MLDAIGADSLKQTWIGGEKLSPYSIAIIYFWQQLGYLVTIFIAGLKMIPTDVLEAVKIDGANTIQEIRYVTIPMMRTTISTVAVLIITGVFKIFEIVQQTTGGCLLYTSNRYRRESEIPFDSDRKLMSTAHTMNQKYTMVVKGAVDVLLTRMSHICIGSEIRKITDEDRQTIEKQNLEFSRDGLRVLAFAYKEMEEERRCV